MSGKPCAPASENTTRDRTNAHLFTQPNHHGGCRPNLETTLIERGHLLPGLAPAQPRARLKLRRKAPRSAAPAPSIPPDPKYRWPKPQLPRRIPEQHILEFRRLVCLDFESEEGAIQLVLNAHKAQFPGLPEHNCWPCWTDRQMATAVKFLQAYQAGHPNHHPPAATC